ncbi:hypothetical protein D3C71_1868380 [compost metagenome]
MAVVACNSEHLRGHVFGQAVLERWAFCEDDFGDACDLGCRLGSSGCAFACHEDVDVGSAGLGGSDGVEGGGLDAVVVVFCNNECGHDVSFKAIDALVCPSRG